MDATISMEEFKGRLIDLKRRFVQKMPDRIAAIASTLAASAAGDGEARARLEREFHTLAGTAGTYGLNAVAAAALEGEEASVGLEMSPLDHEAFKTLTRLVDQLRSALAADAPGQWTARTVLSTADGQDVPLEPAGVSVA